MLYADAYSALGDKWRRGKFALSDMKRLSVAGILLLTFAAWWESPNAITHGKFCVPSKFVARDGDLIPYNAEPPAILLSFRRSEMPQHLTRTFTSATLFVIAHGIESTDSSEIADTSDNMTSDLIDANFVRRPTKDLSSFHQWILYRRLGPETDPVDRMEQVAVCSQFRSDLDSRCKRQTTILKEVLSYTVNGSDIYSYRKIDGFLDEKMSGWQCE